MIDDKPDWAKRDELCRKLNYRLHTAIDPLKYGMLVDDMLHEKIITEPEAKALKHLAHSTLCIFSQYLYRAFPDKPLPAPFISL